MRKATKVLYFFIGLLMLVYTVGSYLALFGNKELQVYIVPVLSNLYGFYAASAFAALTAIVSLVILLKGIFAKRRDRNITVSESGDDGKVEVSEEAIEAMVKRTVETHMTNVQETDIKANLHNGKNPNLSILAKVGQSKGTVLDMKGEALQEKIAADVENLTGLAPEKVDVEFFEVDESR